jgi:hypothetical protein
MGGARYALLLEALGSGGSGTHYVSEAEHYGGIMSVKQNMTSSSNFHIVSVFNQL